MQPKCWAIIVVEFCPNLPVDLHLASYHLLTFALWNGRFQREDFKHFARLTEAESQRLTPSSLGPAGYCEM